MSAQEISHIRTIDLLDVVEDAASIAVASTGTAYSKSFIIPNGKSFSVSYKFTSDGVVDVDVEIESGDVEPTSENSADTTNYAVGNTIESNVGDEVLHYKAPAPTVSKFVRFKFTGNGSNDASTVCDVLKLHYIPLT